MDVTTLEALGKGGTGDRNRMVLWAVDGCMRETFSSV